MTTIYTAFASYRGADKIDISRKSATDGIIWAPSWALLSPFLDKRKGSGLADEDWKEYVKGYLAEMRWSYRMNKEAWHTLLQRPTMTLTCYCKRPEQCHRAVLAQQILPSLGCIYKGEWQEVLL